MFVNQNLGALGGDLQVTRHVPTVQLVDAVDSRWGFTHFVRRRFLLQVSVDTGDRRRDVLLIGELLLFLVVFQT